MPDSLATNPKRPRGKRLHILAFVAALLVLASSAFFERSHSKCDHSELVPHGLVEYRSEINLDQASADSKTLLQLAVDRRLIGMDGSSIKSLVAAADTAADTAEIAHDANFAPTADVYTFKLPCRHRNIADGNKLKFSVAVNPSCGHVVGVGLTAKPDFQQRTMR